MTDTTISNNSTGRSGWPDNWAALFAMGFAAGIGVIVALTTLNNHGSLTGYLRNDRLAGDERPTARIALSLLPTDLSKPLRTANIQSENTPEPRATNRRISPTGESMTVADLESEFSSLNYRLDDVREQNTNVPRIVAASVPADLDNIQEIDRRKAVFFKMLLPLVLITNERLENDRARLEALREREMTGKSISPKDSKWMAAQFESYRVEPGQWDLLLRRVDGVPPSLALAQAAVESGWGTSRFAREGNALFGQWVWGESADGIVPEQRQDGMTHKIKVFETPLQAVAAYIKNLNTHRAYRSLRDIRAKMRREGITLNGAALAAGLESYSEKGHEYIELIRGIISANALRPLDKAKLRNPRA
ncbi:MAG: glucosaminidase domain-containing protein [Alphaproteobacteria bacterium]|nr:glucosaminidase domain-containing protein [Alphaproteobacteria bacterium]